MKRELFAVIALLIMCSGLSAMELSSPNQKITVTLQLQDKSIHKGVGQLNFKVDYDDDGGGGIKEVLPLSPLGLIVEGQVFSNNLQYVSESKPRYIHDKYEMLHGKQRFCENVGNEKSYRFKNEKGQQIEIAFRAYNDGVAFRYLLADSSAQSLNLKDELTAYTISDGTKRWVQPFQMSYEDFYPFTTDGGATS